MMQFGTCYFVRFQGYDLSKRESVRGISALPAGLISTPREMLRPKLLKDSIELDSCESRLVHLVPQARS